MLRQITQLKNVKNLIIQAPTRWYMTCKKTIAMRCPEQKSLSEAENGPKMSIVIVDDNPGSLAYLSTALDSTGLQVFTAPSGEEGLTLVYTHHPQIVLSDLVMPTLSGLDVLRMVKAFDPKISVVIMSSDDPAGAVAKTMEQGGTEYLKKPIALSVLRSCIGQIIQSHQSVAATS